MDDRAILGRPALPPGRTVPYGPAAHHVYEVFGEPWSATHAVVVLVHGGFWRAEWDRVHLRPLAAALAAQGYAVALVEYARSGMSGGGWPGTFEDVAAATAAVREAAGELPVVLVGHSAGGHLAAWMLHRPESAGVRGAISLGGCLDLAMAHDLGLDDGAALDLMGVAPGDDPARWEGADPRRLGATAYPLVVVHGTADDLVPVALPRSWWQACATPGRDVLDELPGVGHFALIDPDAPAHARLLHHLTDLTTAR